MNAMSDHLNCYRNKREVNPTRSWALSTSICQSLQAPVARGGSFSWRDMTPNIDRTTPLLRCL